MKAKILTLILIMAIIAVVGGAAKAQIDPTIQVRDLSNNVLNGQTVHLNTVVIIHCTYTDPAHPSGTGYIDVFLDNGTGFNYLGNIWNGTVNSGQAIQSPPYTLNQMGTYKFAWTVQAAQTSPGPCPETAQVTTTISLVVPEPSALAGLAIALSAFGFFAFRKKPTKCLQGK